MGLFCLLIADPVHTHRGQRRRDGGERRSVHLSADRPAIKADEVKSLLKERPPPDILLTRKSAREVEEDSTTENAESWHSIEERR